MTWTETDHMLHAVGALGGLAAAAIILLIIMIAGLVEAFGSLRARRRAREAHRRADLWLDPRSYSTRPREPRP